MLDDEKLKRFFVGTNIEALKAHQYHFMATAFTAIPKDMDVVGLIRDKHARLFQNAGLNEKHFDMVAGHLVGTLKGLGVAEREVNDAVAVVAPLRAIFQEEAAKVTTANKRQKLQMALYITGAICIVAAGILVKRIM